MELTVEKNSGFCVISINGRIDTTNYNEFESVVKEQLDAGEKHIVLDCTNLNYISSSGLRVFLTTQKALVAQQGKLHLCNMQSTIKEIFDISGFSSIFKIFGSTEEALTA